MKKASETDITNWLIHKFIVDNGLLDFNVQSQTEHEVVLVDETAEMTLTSYFTTVVVNVDDYSGTLWRRYYEQYKALDGEIVWRSFRNE